MAYAVVNTATTSGSVSSITVPSTAAGHLLCFAASYDASATIISVTGAGTWAQIGDQLDVGSNQRAAFWYAPNSSAGVTSISFTPVIAAAVCFVEFSGTTTTTPLDVKDATKAFFSSTTATDAEKSTLITPAGSGELIVSPIFDQSGSAPTFTAGTGFSLAAQVGPAGAGAAAIEWATGAAGSQQSVWTMNKLGDSVTVQIAAFLAAAGATTLPPHPMVVDTAVARSTNY